VVNVSDDAQIADFAEINGSNLFGHGASRLPARPENSSLLALVRHSASLI